MTEQAYTEPKLSLNSEDEHIRMYWEAHINLTALYGAAIPDNFDDFIQWLDNKMEEN